MEHCFWVTSFEDRAISPYVKGLLTLSLTSSKMIVKSFDWEASQIIGVMICDFEKKKKVELKYSWWELLTSLFVLFAWYLWNQNKDPVAQLPRFRLCWFIRAWLTNHMSHEEKTFIWLLGMMFLVVRLRVLKVFSRSVWPLRFERSWFWGGWGGGLGVYWESNHAKNKETLAKSPHEVIR